MSSKEFMGWAQYFKERPYQWESDHRAAIIAQCSYQGKKPLEVDKIFPSLKVFSDSDNAKINKAKRFIDAMQSKTGNKVINTKD